MARNKDDGEGLPRSVRILVALLGAAGGLTGIAALIGVLITMGFIRPPASTTTSTDRKPPTVEVDSPPTEPPIPPTPMLVLSSITADNTATYLGAQPTTGLDQWQWTIYIQGPEAVLERVDYVEYKLHGSFAEPIQRVYNRGTGPQAFPLTATGWGTFTVYITVVMLDGRTHTLTHDLRF